MKNYFYPCLLVIIYLASSLTVSAQEVLWKEQVAWEGVPAYYQKWEYPDFNFPTELSSWKKERVLVAETLQKLLGDIPPRPKKLNVQTVFKKQMNGYILEKFLIDNGVDGWIPGYLAIPSNVKGKVPIVLGLHGHSSSKENIIGSNSSTAQDV